MNKGSAKDFLLNTTLANFKGCLINKCNEESIRNNEAPVNVKIKFRKNPCKSK